MFNQKLFFNLVCIVVVALPMTLHAAPPSTPNVRHLVYSETAIELFWQTPSSNSLVEGYEISRDGEVLGLFDVLSYFDNSLQTGTDYTYTVRAIDANGEISDEARVTLRTRMPETSEDRIAELEQQIRELEAQLGSSIPAPLPETGQTVSIFEGDDGDWQAGVAIPDPRFTINVNIDNDQNQNGVCDNDETCDGSVTDRLTGLVWLQDAGCYGSLDLFNAIAAANGLVGDNTSNCQLTDGSQAGDWRLPNIRELLSLIDFSQSFPDLTLPEDHPFKNIVAFQEEGVFPASYWSSTSSDIDGGYAVSLSVGWVNREIHANDYHVLPVRNQ